MLLSPKRASRLALERNLRVIPDMTAVYLVLGLPGAGRHEVVGSLIEGALLDPAGVAVYHPATELPLPATETKIQRVSFTFQAGGYAITSQPEPPPEPETIFFLTDGRMSVIDQIEAFPALLAARGWELARILVVVDCTLAAAQPKVAEWHEVCVHFADVVLLNRREALALKWAELFQKKFAGLRYPCLFIPVKKGRVDNPLLVLFPEPRRMSLTFDDIDPIDELDLDEENLPEEPFTLENKVDPYFEKLLSGHRCKQVPDVTQFLPKL